MALKLFVIIICFSLANSSIISNIIGDIKSYRNVIKQIFDIVTNYESPQFKNEFSKSTFKNGGIYGKFDIIIVGAGSSGAVLANRLSEISNAKILLLEAGHNESILSDIPAAAPVLQISRVFNWGYKSTVQNGCCLGMNNQQCTIPRGKALGGSSVLNYMMYARGNRHDYDNWADLGNPGWSYDEVLPYFIKSEISSLHNNVDEAYHGKNGTLHVEHVNYFTKLSQAYLDANVELRSKILDYNGKSQLGFSKLQSTTVKGRRCSTNKAFLSRVTSRKNLKIVTGTYVTKILFDSLNKKAEGVQFVIGSKIYTAYATKEVIVSAGVIGSPQLLMLSGIGPEKQLQDLNIPVIQNLDVGKGLADHPFFLMFFSSNYSERKSINNLIIDYLHGKGYLTVAGNIQSIGYINTKKNDSIDSDIEILFSPDFLVAEVDKKVLNFKKETWNALKGSSSKAHGGVFVVLEHPKSRGTVKLASSNPFDYPLIDLNYFDDPDDVEVIVAGIKHVLRIFETKALEKYKLKLVNTPVPACKNLEFGSDDYYRCAVRQVATTLYHQTGTCKMGPVSDPTAVVDSECRVYGVKNLRVIDASVIPLSMAAHTNAPAIMIAEKISDLIKQQFI